MEPTLPAPLRSGPGYTATITFQYGFEGVAQGDMRHIRAEIGERFPTGPPREDIYFIFVDLYVDPHTRKEIRSERRQSAASQI